MLKELLEKDNYDILNFLPFIEYISILDSQNPVLISDNNIKKSRTILFSQNGYEKCKLIILKDEQKEWLGIYKFVNFSDIHNEYVENISFIYFNNNILNQDQESNKIIHFNKFILENTIVTVKSMAYAYQNDDLEIIRKRSRIVEYECIKKYKIDFLANLISHIEENNIPIIEKFDEEIHYVKKNKLKKV